MQSVATAIVMFSVLFPSKGWFAPGQPMTVDVKGAGAPITLMLMDFAGKPIDAQGDEEITGDSTIELISIWPQLKTPGIYLLLAVPKGKSPSEFAGTPLVINVRADRRRDAAPGPMVTRVEPLRYAVISTDKGDVTIIFYYDVAPNTCASFMRLAEGGYFDGLLFHRIIDGFVVQGGDPRGDGTGGPGYRLEAEFSTREHREGALSMARQGDPIEAQGSMPRLEYASSAGSQFFICLDYERTKQLDGRYTVFGMVTDGMDAVKELAKAPTEPQTNRPLTPQVMKSVRILPVTAERNPYLKFLNLSTIPLAPSGPVTPAQPTTAPATPVP